MALAAGDRLGPYEVLSSLGSGGMGEVYRARDGKLNRDVALKILPGEFASDPERLARFKREAQVLASLNHPNIAAIYGLEGQDGRNGPEGPLALVLELVEGPTLADRIAEAAPARGGGAPRGLEMDEALPIARQIAEALEAAHEQAIVHRDLKPANIKVRPDGTVKVLDFGLAKALEPAVNVATGVTNSPTITSPAMMTGVGMLLGTAAYMSPEQAKGRPADKRSDIWAFGCVLFEMLTGKRAFEGDDVSDTLAAVLRGDPDWNALPADLPESIRVLLKSCLERDRKQRVGDISAALYVMRRPGSPSSANVDPSRGRRNIGRQALLGLLLAAATGVVVGVVVWNLKPAAQTPSVVRFADIPPAGMGFERGVLALSQLAVSRDGSQIVYSGYQRLYLRSISEGTARPIPGSDVGPSDNIGAPVFSPDGRSIVYWARSAQEPTSAGNLKRIPTSGGSSVTLAHVDFPLGVSWSGDAILVAQRRGDILKVPATGGTPETLIHLKEGEITIGPQMLPGGNAVLFAVGGIPAQEPGAAAEWDKTARIVVQSLATGQRTVIVEGASAPRYVPTGHLLFVSSGVLFAAPFDAGRPKAVTGRVPVVEGIRRTIMGNFVAGGAQMDVSETGALVYLSGPAALSAPVRDLVIAGPDGRAERLKIPAGAYGLPRVSPDGRQIAFHTDDGQRANVWVYDVSGASSQRQLTFASRNLAPIWSADGKDLAFQSDRDGGSAIYRQRADGTAQAERLTTPDQASRQKPESWSPDGQHLLFTKQTGSTLALWQLSLADRKTSQFADVQAETGVSVIAATFSPNSKWVAYVVPATTRSAVRLFVQPFPATGTKHLVAPNSDSPAWSPNGKTLFFLNLLGNGFQAVPVSIESGFSVGNPTPLPEPLSNFLRSSRTGPGSDRDYDVLPDGRFVAAVPAREGGSTDAFPHEIHIVLNWFEELKQRVPVK